MNNTAKPYGPGKALIGAGNRQNVDPSADDRVVHTADGAR
jgi:hypothetical protein